MTAAIIVVAVAALIVGRYAVRAALRGALGARSRPRLTAEQEAEQRQSLAQLEAGGLPVPAERRLRELTAGPGGFFTSDLSVNEFALLRREGIVPITQVMGSSVFKHGWRSSLPSSWGRWDDGYTQELDYVSKAFNGARARALKRLLDEAELAGADAVVAVRLSTGGHAWLEADTVEFTAVGTAVRLPEALRGPHPVITDLSAQEFFLLVRAGSRPAGVVGHTTVLYVASGWRQNRVLTSGSSLFSMAGRANQELPDFTRGFYEARETAMLEASVQAKRLGADGLVGVTFDEHLESREYDSNNTSWHDLVVTVHVLGTAITDGHAPVASAEKLSTALSLSPR